MTRAEHDFIFGHHSEVNLNDVISDPNLAHLGDLIPRPSQMESPEEPNDIFPNSQLGSMSADTPMDLDASLKKFPPTANLDSTSTSFFVPVTITAPSDDNHKSTESFKESRLFDKSGKLERSLV